MATKNNRKRKLTKNRFSPNDLVFVPYVVNDNNEEISVEVRQLRVASINMMRRRPVMIVRDINKKISIEVDGAYVHKSKAVAARIGKIVAANYERNLFQLWE